MIIHVLDDDPLPSLSGTPRTVSAIPLLLIDAQIVCLLKQNALTLELIPLGVTHPIRTSPK